MDQEEKTLKNQVQEQPNQTEMLCSPPHPLAVGHLPSQPYSLFWHRSLCPSAPAVLTVKRCPLQRMIYLSPPRWGGETGAVGSATFTPSNTGDFVRLGRHLGRSPTKILPCSKFNTKTNTAEVFFWVSCKSACCQHTRPGSWKAPGRLLPPSRLLGPAPRSQGSPHHPSWHRASLHYLLSSVNQVMAKYCCEKIPVLKT